MWAIMGVLLLLVVLVATPRAEAVPSRLCRRLAERNTGAQQADRNRPCEPAVCGTLSDGASTTTFSSRLSESCAAEMSKYRTAPANGEWLVKRFPGSQDWREWSKCANGNSALQATNPVVINVRGLQPFMLCSVPKVACTNLRKLLQAILAKPGAPYDPDPDAQMHLAHFGSFPTLWHYRRANAQVTDTFPSLTVGRNPYVRLLSAFLDKMVYDPVVNQNSHDWNTMGYINAQLGSRKGTYYAASAEDFARFVNLLALRPGNVTDINEHIRLQVYACDQDVVNYEYRLRLEDMALWYPCFVEGLQLASYTAVGWTAKGDAWLGPREGTGCWWKPHGWTCEEYAAAARDGAGRAQPVHLDAAGDVTLRDSHDTGASRSWQRYYSQELADLVYTLYQRDFQAFGYERAVIEPAAGAEVAAGQGGVPAEQTPVVATGVPDAGGGVVETWPLQGAAQQQVPVVQQQGPVAQQQVPTAQQQVPVAQQQVPVVQQQVLAAQQALPGQPLWQPVQGGAAPVVPTAPVVDPAGQGVLHVDAQAAVDAVRVDPARQVDPAGELAWQDDDGAVAEVDAFNEVGAHGGGVGAEGADADAGTQWQGDGGDAGEAASWRRA